MAKMICENAKCCKVKDCPHRKRHEFKEGCCYGGCTRLKGVTHSICIPVKAKLKNIADCQWCINKLKDLVKEMEGKAK
jgi:hypothetical protein